MKTQQEIENVIDALSGHSDETIPKALEFTASISPAAIIMTLEWVLKDGV